MVHSDRGDGRVVLVVVVVVAVVVDVTDGLVRGLSMISPSHAVGSLSEGDDEEGDAAVFAADDGADDDDDMARYVGFVSLFFCVTLTKEHVFFWHTQTHMQTHLPSTFVVDLKG
jgi:hypothetical protein